jgi:hypothetical protein
MGEVTAARLPTVFKVVDVLSDWGEARETVNDSRAWIIEG